MAVAFSQSDSTTNIMNVPEPTKEPRQRSIGQDDLYLSKFISPWSRPASVSADAWRWWIYNEPIAMICRETLTANILALDWEITPRKSEDMDELRAVVRHYTKLLEKGGDYYGFDWTGLIEWVMSDLQDLPFGSGAEIGRKNDSPTGRVLWVKPLDGGTLYPTLNRDFPAVQYYSTYDVVTFPAHAFVRTYMSPRAEILREGWGMAPPEKIYFALLMLYRGDKYYADLLLDSPPAGILDLGDMERDSAMDWVAAFREFVAGAPSSFKIPVLYEHTTDTKFIPFGKVPNDIMYDRITLKYAAIVAAAYGMSLSDIGLQTTSASGETLAGSIRQERRTKRTGFARAKKKIKYFIESFLPDVLQFNFIDLDDELNVALGRTRLSNATAQKIWIESKQFSPAEMRLQNMADGIITINIPEKPPADSEFPEMTPAERKPGLLGNPVAPSGGGEGEVKKMKSISLPEIKNLESHLKRLVGDITKSIGRILAESAESVDEDELYLVRSVVDDSLFGETDLLGLAEILKTVWEGKRWFKLDFADTLADELLELSEKSVADYLQEKTLKEYENGLTDDNDTWVDQFQIAKDKLRGVNWKQHSSDIEKALNEGVKLFIGKSATFMLKDIILSENAFDNEEGEGDNIVDKVYRSLYDNFEQFVSAYISMEVEKIVLKIRNEVI